MAKEEIFKSSDFKKLTEKNIDEDVMINNLYTIVGAEYRSGIFDKYDLSSRTFIDCNFDDVAIECCILDRTIFIRCSFKGSIFTDNLIGEDVQFINCEFIGASISELHSSTFANCSIINAISHAEALFTQQTVNDKISIQGFEYTPDEISDNILHTPTISISNDEYVSYIRFIIMYLTYSKKHLSTAKKIISKFKKYGLNDVYVLQVLDSYTDIYWTRISYKKTVVYKIKRQDG